MQDKPPVTKPRIYPPVWVLISALAMAALHHWLPLYHFAWVPETWTVWLLMAPGMLIMLIAAVAFGRARTGIIPFSESTQLLTGGLYRFTRNPMYLGMALALAGAAVALGSLSAWIPVPLFVWVIQKEFIVREEAFLEDIYGEAYRQYCQRVRRWL